MSKFGWSYPAGCTQSDIDFAFGDEDDTEGMIGPWIECSVCHAYGSFDPHEFQHGPLLWNGGIDEDLPATWTCGECLDKRCRGVREDNPLEGIDGYHNSIGGASCPNCGDQGCYQCSDTYMYD